MDCNDVFGDIKQVEISSGKEEFVVAKNFSPSWFKKSSFGIDSLGEYFKKNFLLKTEKATSQQNIFYGTPKSCRSTFVKEIVEIIGKEIIPISLSIVYKMLRTEELARRHLLLNGYANVFVSSKKGALCEVFACASSRGWYVSGKDISKTSVCNSVNRVFWCK